MNKTSWVILILCLLILVSIAAIYSESGQYQQASNASSMPPDPLFDAIHAKQYANVEELVKKNPVILKHRHAQGGTYMNCAASMRDIKMMKILLKYGGNPNGAAGCGMAPIIIASGSKDVAMVKLLLESGADPNIFGHATSPLTTAKQLNDTAMINLLLKHGAKEIIRGPITSTAVKTKQ